MQTVLVIFRKLAAPFLAGMGVAAATLASGLGVIAGFAAAAGLLGFASNRAAARLAAARPASDSAERD